MLTLLILLIILLSGGLEIVLCRKGNLSRVGKMVLVVDLVFLGISSGALLASHFNLFSGLLIVVNAYRALNILRLVERRMHRAYLRRAATRTVLMLLTIQLLAIVAWVWWPMTRLTVSDLLDMAAIFQLVGASILLLGTVRTLNKAKYRASSEQFADRDLPTVTVAIPARNETEDLSDCLRAVLANDYPKLEILVLDDCSQDKTPEIIRDFAHDGVRFIRGAPLRDNWLAKNQAYARLAEEANGQFILFCGVDARLGSQTIRGLVISALTRKKEMVSVLPKRYDGGLGLALIQPARYWWELALPRRLFNRPPVLSTCWMIEKRAIKKAGGFAAVSRSITPEGYFARKSIPTDGYSFLRGNELLDVKTVKHFRQQLQTAIRVRYPQLHRRPETVLLLSLAEILLLILPFALAIAGFWLPLGSAHIPALLASLILIITHSLIITVTNPSNWWLALLTFPLVAVAELALNHISLYQYEFSTVTWKGRNICAPVMHVTPRLPAPGK